jgi:hypothetical protein
MTEFETSGGRVQKSGGKAAKILYQPVGIASSIVAGVVAGQVFKQVYKRIAPKHPDDAPGPLQSEYPLWEVLVAATVQGMIFSVTKALVARGGARAFEKMTGDWPGD